MPRSPLDYKPSHKKPEPYAGGTPKGVHRWARAGANAILRPNGPDALLYQRRTVNAVLLRDKYDEWRNTRWYIANYYNESKRDFTMCSLFCAAMVAQLDILPQSVRKKSQALQLEDLERAMFIDVNRIWLLEDKLKRTVECGFCGSKIKP